MRARVLFFNLKFHLFNLLQYTFSFITTSFRKLSSLHGLDLTWQECPVICDKEKPLALNGWLSSFLMWSETLTFTELKL